MRRVRLGQMKGVGRDHWPVGGGGGWLVRTLQYHQAILQLSVQRDCGPTTRPRPRRWCVRPGCEWTSTALLAGWPVTDQQGRFRFKGKRKSEKEREEKEKGKRREEKRKTKNEKRKTKTKNEKRKTKKENTEIQSHCDGPSTRLVLTAAGWLAGS